MDEVFQTILNEFILPIWIKDLDLKFIYANDMYGELVGRNADEIIGLKNEDIFDLKLAQSFNKDCRKAIKEERAIVVDSVYSGAYTQCSIMPLKDSKGKIRALTGVIGIINETGIIKEKETELKLQKDLTNTIIDTLPGIIFYKNIEGRYIYINDEGLKFYKERGIYEVLGKTDAEINPNKEQVEKFLADDRWVIENKKEQRTQAIFKNKNATLQYRKVIKVPLFGYHGEVVGIIGRSADVTKEMEYRQKLEYLSYTDILTGAKNRTAFEEFDQEISVKEKLPIGLIMGDANGLKLINDTFGHRSGDEYLIQVVEILKEVTKENVFRIGGDEFVVVIPNTTLEYCEELAEKLKKSCAEYKGSLFRISVSFGCAIKKDIEEDIYDVLAIAEDTVYKGKLNHNESLKSTIINSIKKNCCLDNKETEEHALRVTRRAVKMAEALGIKGTSLLDLKIAAEFHDVGKVVLPEEILLKPTKLTKEEYDLMKTHPEKGYRIMKASGQSRSVAEIILHHHEKWDGTGYPAGLKGEEIPLTSRILCLSDSYDIMRSERIYTKSMSKEDAFAEIKRCTGTQFDPKVVETFFEVIAKDEI